MSVKNKTIITVVVVVLAIASVIRIKNPVNNLPAYKNTKNVNSDLVQNLYFGLYKNIVGNASIKISPENENKKRLVFFNSAEVENEIGSWTPSITDKYKMSLAFYEDGSDIVTKGFVNVRFSNDYKKLIVIKSDFPDQIPVNTLFNKVY